MILATALLVGSPKVNGYHNGSTNGATNGTPALSQTITDILEIGLHSAFQRAAG